MRSALAFVGVAIYDAIDDIELQRADVHVQVALRLLAVQR
jgi:hypothetical protein